MFVFEEKLIIEIFIMYMNSEDVLFSSYDLYKQENNRNEYIEEY